MKYPLPVTRVLTHALFLLLLFLVACTEKPEIPDRMPHCSITWPETETLIERGTIVTISVDAYDIDGQIASLRYLINDNVMSCGSSADYSYLWNTSSEDTGHYHISVLVEDNEGNVDVDEVFVRLVAGRDEAAPEVDFTSSANYIQPGESVHFTDLSTNTPENWFWDFGDGAVSLEQNPVHAFDSIGSYSVALTACNAFGSDSLRKPLLIHVSQNGAEMGTVSDAEGHVYSTVKIGDQWWMAENLRSTRYAGGGEIPLLEHSTDWSKLEADDKAMCYFDNTLSVGEDYGALYTWAAAMNGSKGNASNPGTVQGVCPSGWHMPTDAEWMQLEMFLGMSSIAAGSMGHRGANEGSKLAGRAEYWKPGELKEDAAFGSTGFSALPSGGRNGFGAFLYLGSHSAMWSATAIDAGAVWSRCLYNDYTEVRRYSCQKEFGFAVRCVKNLTGRLN